MQKKRRKTPRKGEEERRITKGGAAGAGAGAG